jgi:hypothetical protein
MKYIVEIANLQGETATKEYEAHSISEVVQRVQCELRKYPKLHLVQVMPGDLQRLPQRRGKL